jgi:hypothetical protein
MAKSVQDAGGAKKAGPEAEMSVSIPAPMSPGKPAFLKLVG